MHISTVDHPPGETTSDHYLSNISPLVANPLSKLPLGTVKPRGWLKHQMELMAQGMAGNLEEISYFATPESGWLGGDQPGWEEPAYWLRGLYPLAVLLDNDRCLNTAKKWLEPVLGSQDEDGYFGAAYHKKLPSINAKQTVCDLWPHMVMLDPLIQLYEHTADERVIPLMRRFFVKRQLFLPVATIRIAGFSVGEIGVFCG